jgi:hypothetical protein
LGGFISVNRWCNTFTRGVKRHRKKQLYVTNQAGAAAGATGLFAQERFAEEMSVTRATLWRWRRDGLLKTINIRGRHYVTAEAAADFKQRALAGQFAKLVRRPSRAAGAGKRKAEEINETE